MFHNFIVIIIIIIIPFSNNAKINRTTITRKEK